MRDGDGTLNARDDWVACQCHVKQRRSPFTSRWIVTVGVVTSADVFGQQQLLRATLSSCQHLSYHAGGSHLGKPPISRNVNFMFWILTYCFTGNRKSMPQTPLTKGFNPSNYTNSSIFMLRSWIWCIWLKLQTAICFQICKIFSWLHHIQPSPT